MIIPFGFYINEILYYGYMQFNGCLSCTTLLKYNISENPKLVAAFLARVAELAGVNLR
jgi:hypothetical protein